jgi:two-component system chemotaxis response regulator CheB
MRTLGRRARGGARLAPAPGTTYADGLSEPFEIVALAASAGGLGALTRVLSALPGDFPAALAVVQHVDPRHRSLMAEILARRTRLKVSEAKNGERLQPGHVYIAPPNHHLLIDPDRTVSLTQTKLVHFLRPSADLLFESVAATYGERSIAVVLSGTGEDGSLGVAAVKKVGGTVIVQDPKNAEFPGMPEAAAKNADFVLTLDDIAPALQQLCPPRTEER